MTNSGSYSDVLKVKGIQPFLWMQFLNAFNDNIYKLAVSLLAVLIPANAAASGTYLSLAGFIFVVPFLLFSGYAGELADRFEKRTVIVITKAFEVAAMTFALFALRSGNIEWMLAVLFFAATQAAVFSPAKYGIVPELVSDKFLARANGLLEMSTFVAIILGTVGGSYMVAIWKDQPTRIGWVLIAIAVAGLLISLRVTRTSASASQRRFSLNPFGDILTGTKRLAKDRVLMLSVVGTTFFWFLGALFQMLLLLFGKEMLHATETQTGLLMAALAVGIGFGSMAAGRLSGERVEYGLVPIGAFGMAIAAFALAVTHGFIPCLLILVGLGFMGGLFVVPLNAILQGRPGAGEKGRIIATANFVNTVGIMLASATVWLMHETLHLSAAAIIGFSGVLTLIGAAWAFNLVPKFTVRFVLYLLTTTVFHIKPRGQENIPQTGAALLVANHVSYADGFMIGACTSRFVRYMVTDEWYDRFRVPLSFFYAIRIPVGTRRSIFEAIELARQELKKGHLVCIFAEGSLTLNGNIGEFHRGLERIVEGLDVPVVPVHLGGLWGNPLSLHPKASMWHSLKKLPFAVSVSFGKPMADPAASEVRQAVSELAAEAAHDLVRPSDTLAKQFVKTARKNWSRRAITDSSGRTFTYGRTLIASDLLAKWIRRHRAAEKMIGVMLPATGAAAIVNLGIVLAGRIPVNLNFTAGSEAIDSAMRQCSLRTILTSKKFLEKAELRRLDGRIFVEDLLLFGKTAKFISFVRARLFPARLLSSRKTKADDLAAVLFSSGSTGAPKGIMLSHRNLLSNTESVQQLLNVDETDTIAGVLPLFHAFGFTYTLWFPLLNGASAAYHPQPLDAKGFGELVQKSKATFLPAPPAFCQAYVRGCSKEQFASLKHVLVGAEKLQPTLAQAFEEKFGITLLEGYGATEMSPVISVNIPDREADGVKQVGFRLGSVGLPLPGIAATVVDCETGEPLQTGESGLLLVRGPNRMMGYLNRTAETEAVMRDGWYVTGDIATMNAAGFITLVDRQSRFSKVAGEMIPHGKVEEVLQSVTGGAPCVVTGTSDERKGERLIAFVATHDITPQEIWQQMMASTLPKMWIPKTADIRVIDELPVLGTGKVDLGAIRQMATTLAVATAV